MATLGQIIEQKCYRGGATHNSTKYCHNCAASGGTKTVWTWEVLHGTQVIGHIVSEVNCDGRCGTESDQYRRHREAAERSLPA